VKRKDSTSGLSSSTDDRILVARVGRPHGLLGEVTVLPQSDDPGLFMLGAVLTDQNGRDLTVLASRPYRDRGLLVAFEGVGDRAAAEALRGSLLTVAADDRRSLESGEWWPEDLVGLEAVGPDGAILGIVADVVTGAFQDRLVIDTPSGTTVEVPFVDELVDDPVGGRIVVTAPPGLFD
jgi:16S rRNA processing protein RimM